MLRPKTGTLQLAEWASANRESIEKDLMTHGGVLFRGFELDGSAGLEEVVAAIAGASLEYKERSSPRSRVEGNIYTSTDYPPSHPIFLHNENSYQETWPMKIFFGCVVEPTDRGETPIADTRKVFRRLAPELREKFAERGWSYVRNFGEGLGLDWPTVFQTTDREAVEAYCRSKGIVAEWLEGGRLRTRAVRPAMALHPVTGEPVWFNHATFFHVSTLSPEIRGSLLELYAEEDLPANTYYGDGSPIESEVLEALRAAYDAETVSFPWRRGDVLLLDNMLVAHGRAPYTGERKIVVGMAEPCRWDEVETRFDPDGTGLPAGA
jgi:alpha-ketoglutarate-dependent taurine dioxygenase